jgi:hypothetical protein
VRERLARVRTRALDHWVHFRPASIDTRLTARLLDQVRWIRSAEKARDPIELSSIQRAKYLASILVRKKSAPSELAFKPCERSPFQAGRDLSRCGGARDPLLQRC